MTNVLYKTKMCNYELAGNCRHGNVCLHAHSPEELRRSPDFRKTKLCRLFQKGLCQDPSCSRAHGEGELRRVDQFYKKKVCKYWKEQGSCIRGPDCYFAHSEAEMGSGPSTRIASPSTRNGTVPKVPPPPPRAMIMNTTGFSMPHSPLLSTHQRTQQYYDNNNQNLSHDIMTGTLLTSSIPNAPLGSSSTMRQHSLPLDATSLARSASQRRQEQHLLLMGHHHPSSFPSTPSSPSSTQDLFADLTTSLQDPSERANIPFVQEPAREWTPSQVLSLLTRMQPNGHPLSGVGLAGIHEDETLRRLHELEMEKAELLKLRLLRHFAENQTVGQQQQSITSPLITRQPRKQPSQHNSKYQHLREPSLSIDSSTSSTESLSKCPLISTTAAALQLITQQQQINQAQPHPTELTQRLIENLIALTSQPQDHDRYCPCGGAQRSDSTSSVVTSTSSKDSTRDNSRTPSTNHHPTIPGHSTSMNHLMIRDNINIFNKHPNTDDLNSIPLFPTLRSNEMASPNLQAEHHFLNHLPIGDQDVEKLVASLFDHSN